MAMCLVVWVKVSENILELSLPYQLIGVVTIGMIFLMIDELKQTKA
jgi:hypothetical protein